MEIRWRCHGDSVRFDGDSPVRAVGDLSSQMTKTTIISIHFRHTFFSLSSEAQKLLPQLVLEAPRTGIA